MKLLFQTASRLGPSKGGIEQYRERSFGRSARRGEPTEGCEHGD